MQGAQSQTCVAFDGGEQIVKVVSDASCQLANNLHFLCLQVLFFQLQFVRHVSLHIDVIDDLAPFVSHRSDGTVHSEDCAVLFSVYKAPAPRLFCCEGLPQVLIKGLVLFSALEEARVAAKHVGTAVPCDLLKARVDIDDGPLYVGDDYAVRRLADGSGEQSALLVEARTRDSAGQLIRYSPCQAYLLYREAIWLD